jgi:hypothetical protein
MASDHLQPIRDALAAVEKEQDDLKQTIADGVKELAFLRGQRDGLDEIIGNLRNALGLTAGGQPRKPRARKTEEAAQ